MRRSCDLGRRRVAIAALGLAVLAIPAGLAAAQVAAPTPGPSASTHDAAADVTGKLDVTRFALARSRSDGRLAATVTLAAPWAPADLVADSGPPGSICVRLWTTTTAPDEPPTYLVCATADAHGALRGSVLRERANQLPERVAGARVAQRSERTLTLRFSQTSVGRPAAFATAAEVTQPGCMRFTCRDTAPDAAAVLRLQVRPTTQTDAP